MLATESPETESFVAPERALEHRVVLANGTEICIGGMSCEQLAALQWDQEPRFAESIRNAPKRSRERSEAVARAYDTICTILATQAPEGRLLVMGLDKRYAKLVLELLRGQVRRGIGRPLFFEIGYGSGSLLKEVAKQGFEVGGVEVSSTMRTQAVGVLGEAHASRLLLGNLTDISVDNLGAGPSLVYWNDVFEHICPDEIADYLAQIYNLLVPGGSLVTITPNWVLRPSDVTGDFCPPRTEARGLHLKEYRLAEVTRLLKQAGFRKTATPLAVSRQRIYLAGNGLLLFKQWAEPLLDRLPVRSAHLLCRGMGLSCTIATK